ncbi:DUF2637 domain-containing protein [Kitasatospora sp. NPDC001540]|uniref:DUF2637 domain-containing protein n=1 Tax=Kitasatospora sp. NPDC001540 TaxID=3364014 RepID=UPI0036CEAD7A
MHRLMIGVIAIGAVLIAGIGLGGSYLAVRDLALRKGMAEFAYAFPIGVDVGIILLLVLDLFLAWMRIPFPLLRPMAWFFTAATIAFNAATAWPDPVGVGMHGVIPVMFIVITEASRHAIARLAQLGSHRSIDRIRLIRWLLAPVQTWRLWRRMQLWEIRSLDEAIRGEQALQTYNILVETGRRRGRQRLRDRGLPPAARLPRALADLGVPLDVTYEAGLAAAGVDPEPLGRLLAHQARTAASPAVPPPAAPAAPAAPAVPAAPGQLLPGEEDAARVPDREAAPVAELLRADLAEGAATDEEPAAATEPPWPAQGPRPRPLPLPRSDEAEDREEAPQTDGGPKIPPGWAEGFRAFVEEFRRHPDQTELPEFLYVRGFKSNKAGDGPVSPESVRRYHNKLCGLHPVPDADARPGPAPQEALAVR